MVGSWGCGTVIRMKSWPQPTVPAVPGSAVPLSLYDTADQNIRQVTPAGQTATLYVCGITPYDSTHLGHAATYLTFDLVQRVLIDNGYPVHYVQNVTDVDDPLFERAERDGVDWKELGDSQVDLFRSDMEVLSVIPPRDYIGVIDSVDEVIEMVQTLLDNGSAYQINGDQYPDIYFRTSATGHFGYESNYTDEEMAEAFAERGGDPERAGKENPLDALLWRARRDGEPSWDAPFGEGRPGWHIECSAIAANRLGVPFDIQGGGSDLAFPHHEFSAAHAEAAHNHPRMASHYSHAGMIGLDGVKMSKSLGNLVFVSKLSEAGVDPSAIRLGVFASHYRSDRDWSDAVLEGAQIRLDSWRDAVEEQRKGGAEAVGKLREALSNDLDTAGALAAIDEWAAGAPGGTAEDSELVKTALDGLLGVKL